MILRISPWSKWCRLAIDARPEGDNQQHSLSRFGRTDNRVLLVIHRPEGTICSQSIPDEEIQTSRRPGDGRILALVRSREGRLSRDGRAVASHRQQDLNFTEVFQLMVVRK